MRFSGKTVYVTQADTAQGEALALRFAKEGANLVLGFGKEDLVKKVEDLGAKAMVVQPDMLTYEGAEALVEEVKKTFGRIDALIFNNNNVVKTDLEHLTREVFESQLNDNAKAAFVLARVIGLHMAEYHNGKIVFVSSIHCDKPTGSAVMYSISKGCINMLCKECALFFGRRGIQTNLIEAGAVEGDDEKFESTFSPVRHGLHGGAHPPPQGRHPRGDRCGRGVPRLGRCQLRQWRQRARGRRLRAVLRFQSVKGRRKYHESTV